MKKLNKRMKAMVLKCRMILHDLDDDDEQEQEQEDKNQEELNQAMGNIDEEK